MTCHRADELMQTSLDRALTGRERAHLDAHLIACSSCRRTWEEYRQLSRLAGEWTRRSSPDETPAALFTAQVLARLPTEDAPRPIYARAIAFGVLTLLVALSPWVSRWLPPLTAWRVEWGALPLELSLSASLIAVMAHWASLLLLPALALNALLYLRARRVA